MHFFIYNLILLALFPAVLLFITIRLFNKKETLSSIYQKLSLYTLFQKNNSKVETVWLHAVSVGESKSTLPIIKEINKSFPNFQVLLTTSTIGSFKFIQKIKSNGGYNFIHKFCPIDLSFIVKNFINFWQPKKLIIFETDIWPNMISISQKLDIETYIVNGKLSKQTQDKWLKYNFSKKIFIDILRNIKLIVPSTACNRDSFLSLELKNVADFYLNTKNYIQEKLTKEQVKLLNFYKQKIKKNKKAIFVSNIHLEEIGIIIPKIISLAEKIGALLIIAPRHYDQFANKYPNYINNDNVIFDDLSYQDYDKKDIIIVRSFGMLNIFYKLADITLLCGSFVKEIGGHNPFESIYNETPVICGNFYENYLELYEELKNLEIITISNESSFIAEIESTINNNDKISSVIDKIKNFNDSKSGNDIEKITRKIF
jgi:3-deoxy-D-manno-octulosonic-acid transferase